MERGAKMDTSLGGDATRRGPSAPPATRWRWAAALASVAAVAGGISAYVSLEGVQVPSSHTVLRPTGTILMSVRGLARLETNELHLEKVIDLADKQSRLFGLIDTNDAL